MNDHKLDQKSPPTTKDVVSDLAEITKKLQSITAEKQALDKYLDTNIFDFTEGSVGFEDIFAIQEQNLALVDQLDRSYLRLDRTIPLFEVRHLTKYYPNLKIPTIVNASFKVYPGDFHAIVGASGSGKTTLVKCLLQKTDYDGEILVANHVISNENLNQWAPHIAVVDFNANYGEEQSLTEILEAEVQAKASSRIRAASYVRNCLQELKMWNLRSRRFIDLTLLEKRKLALGIALINQPELLVFDEPLMGLQQHEQTEYLVLLAKLQKQQRAVVVLSHQIDQFAGFANTMTIINQGKVFYSGLTANLELHQLLKFSIHTANNDLALKLLQRIDCELSPHQPNNALNVKFANEAALLAFQKTCAQHDLVIFDLRHGVISLEDLYDVLIKVGSGDAIRQIQSAKAPNNDLVVR